MSVTVKRVQGSGAKTLDVLVKGLANKEGMVGWFSEARYQDGSPVAGIAVVQEFGSPKMKIPPRSFMRTTVAEKREKWAKIIADASKAILKGNETPQNAMLALATQAKDDIKTKIRDIRDPALSPITLGLRKYKLGLIPGFGPGPVTGRTVGIIASMLSRGTLSASGVSDKPLIEPPGIPGSGTLLRTIDAKVQ